MMFNLKDKVYGQGAHTPYPPTKLEKERLKSNTFSILFRNYPTPP